MPPVPIVVEFTVYGDPASGINRHIDAGKLAKTVERIDIAMCVTERSNDEFPQANATFAVLEIPTKISALIVATPPCCAMNAFIDGTKE